MYLFITLDKYFTYWDYLSYTLRLCVYLILEQEVGDDISVCMLNLPL